MSHSQRQPNECTTHFHDRRDFDNMDLEEWLKDEDEQWANIERYEAALNNDLKHVIPNDPAPKGFLAPQVSVLEGFLAPQVTASQQVLAPHVPVESPLEIFSNEIESGKVEGPSYLYHSLPQNAFSPVLNKSTTNETLEAEELNNINLSSDIYEQRFVGSKTSTSSHAKKYLTHNNAPKGKRKRENIHDTTLQDTDVMLLHPIDQQNSVPIPNFAMQQPQDVMQFNLPSNMPQCHKMDEHQYVNNDPHHIDQQNLMSDLDLVVDQFLGKQQAQYMLPQSNPPENMSHQRGGYGHSNTRI